MKLKFLAAALLLAATTAGAKGRIQDSDVKSLTEITAAGGSMSGLINDSKIYVGSGGINQQLSTAITGGLIAGGGGGSAISSIANYGAEASLTGATGSTPANLTRTTTSTLVLAGNASFAWTPTAANETVSFPSVAVPVGLQGANCSASLLYKGAGGSNITLSVSDGTNVLASSVLTTSTQADTKSISFICPSSGNYQLKLTAAAAGAQLIFDQVTLGQNTQTAAVSQAAFVGAAKWPATASCSWSSTSSATFSNYSAVAACTLPAGANLEGAASAPATKVPGLTFASLPPGRYVATATGSFFAGSAGQQCSYRFWDGTTGTSGQIVAGPTGGNTQFGGIVFGEWNYASAQSNVTMQLQGTGRNSSAQCDVQSFDANTGDLKITVYRYPTGSEQAVRADAAALSWSGYQTVASGWSTSSASITELSAGTTVALFQLSNRNFGSVTSAAAGLAGILVPFPRAGVYKVCAAGTFIGSAAQTAASLRLVDGSGSVIHQGSSFLAVLAGAVTPYSICGNYAAASAGAQTLKIQGAINGGTLSIANGNGGITPAINWTVESLDGGSNAPVLVGSVTSNSAGSERVERLAFGQTGGSTTATSNCTSSPCAIYSQSGSWVSSVTRTGAGQYTVAFNGQPFSSIPQCTMNWNNGGFAGSIQAQTLTGFNVITVSIPAGAGVQDSSPTILCMGPR